jgi:V-type H+-transporting ATPase subunit F
LIQNLICFIDTSLAELEEALRGFLAREDIAILLIVQYVADMVRHVIENHHKLTPAILEIPSKEHAYDPSKDFILKRAQVIFKIYVSISN